MEFKKIFISHRSFDYDKALQLEKTLLNHNVCSEVVLLKNETLCRNFEQLTIREYYMAVMKIMQKMEGCDAFFYLDCPNYRNGYFTNVEVILWQLTHMSPMIYSVEKVSGGFVVSSPIKLPPISSTESKRIHFYKNSMMFNVEYGTTFEPWGKYASCFLVGCANCGKYYLISPKSMEYYIRSGEKAKCPNCGICHATFCQNTKSKKYFSNRFPIILNPSVCNIADLEPLNVNDVMDLMNAKELDKRFALILVKGEKLKSDLRNSMVKFGKILTTVIGLVGTFIVIINRDQNEK